MRFSDLAEEAKRRQQRIHEVLLDSLYETPSASTEVCADLEGAFNAATDVIDGASTTSSSPDAALDAAVYLNMFMYHSGQDQARMRTQCAEAISNWILNYRRHPGLSSELAKEFAYAEVALDENTRERYRELLFDRGPAQLTSIPIVREYLLAWEYRAALSSTVEAIRKATERRPERLKPSTLLSVHSVKGGTGKTTLSTAAAIGMTGVGEASQADDVCLLDWDFSGPSVDYFIADEKLDNDIKQLTYKTFFSMWDRVRKQEPLPSKPWYLQRPGAADWCAHALGLPQSGAFSLGAWLAYLATDPERSGEFRELVEKVIRHLRRGGVRHLVVDNSPGLYSHSAIIFALISALGGLLCFVTTRRYDCLIPTMYELAWDWQLTQGQICVVVNMTDTTYGVREELEKLKSAARAGIFEGGRTVPPYLVDHLRTLRYVIPERTAARVGRFVIFGGQHVPYWQITLDKRLEYVREIKPEDVWRCLQAQLDEVGFIRYIRSRRRMTGGRRRV